MSKTKWICLLVVAVMLLSLAGCASTANQSSETTQAQTTSTGSAQTSSTASAEKVTLTFWDMPWGAAEYTAEAQALCSEFTKQNPNITINYQQIPWDNWIPTFVTAVSSNAGPDVSTGGAFLQHRMATMNEILNIDSLKAELKADGTLEDYVAGTMDNFTYNGVQIALPINMDFRGLFYRTDIFEAAGISKLPTNWDEFYAIAKQLSKGDQYGYVYSGADSSAHWVMMIWSMNNGGGYLNKDLKPDLTNEKNIQALDFIAKLKDDGLVPPGVAGYTNADATRLFSQGKAAMIYGAPGLINDLPDDIKKVTAVMPALTSPAGLTQNPGSVNGIMGFSDSKYPDQAKAFIKWWSNNCLSLWTKGNEGPMPTRLSFMKDAFFQQDPIKSQFISKIVPNTVLFTFPVGHAAPEMDIMDGEQMYTNVMQERLTTNKDSKTVLAEYNEIYAKAIEQMNSGK